MVEDEVEEEEEDEVEEEEEDQAPERENEEEDDKFEDAEETEVEDEKIANENQEQELRRSKRICKKPDRYTHYVYLTYKGSCQQFRQKNWIQAINEITKRK
ncbi:hypothetical protein RF55_1168 [Lasius niger]|uniref:Uncharacterized protein n=1 Tax=Lasius niger TaxID=67767 RepID=A0A0J7L667_LASNI|nr:hypothetical protein RF55_1168 [Lasius niger]